MVKTETREIDGLTFEVTQLPFMRQGKVFARLAAAFGPALAKMADGGLDRELGSALEVLFARLTESEFDYLVKALLETAYVRDGDRRICVGQNPDAVLSGRNMTGLKLLKFAVEVNWQDFFGALTGNLTPAPVV